jgi:glycerol uptake facilitator-like aquaporin
VTAVFLFRKEVKPPEALAYITVQVIGAILGVWAAHMMFDEGVLQMSTKVRAGPAQWFSEFVAAFGLVLTILLTSKAEPRSVPASVGLYIVAAYWFTASTSFANPAVTIARGFSNTFAGIRPVDVAPFIVAQMIGAVSATLFARQLLVGGPIDNDR